MGGPAGLPGSWPPSPGAFVPLESSWTLQQNKVQLLRSTMPLDVLLVDDHKIMRDGIKAILSRGNEFRVVGEAENGAEAVQFCKRLRPHLVLMDIGLPG